MIDRPVVPQPHDRTFGQLSNRPFLVRQGLLVIFVLLCIGVMTFALYLYVLPNSQMSEAQAHIASLRAQVFVLNRQTAENLRLATELTSLPALEARAKKLGLGPPRKLLYMPQSVAGSQRSAPRQTTAMPSAKPAQPVSQGLPQIIKGMVERLMSQLQPASSSQ